MDELNLYTFVLEGQHLDEQGDMFEEGDENAPFFSEAYLYNLVGKEDARTILAVVRQTLLSVHLEICNHEEFDEEGDWKECGQEGHLCSIAKKYAHG